ncbi:nitrite reductase [Dendrosporobacter sp. 1207_IL3150]|uniref:nitrite reductase n=1 Tax=Dendrosporobacter sp. 1207_IL3150 TaxID=3084054 RepID=UPI002FDABF16
MTLPLAKIPFLNKRIKFPVSPHIPGGFTNPDQLRKIAEIADKYGGTLKIMGNGITIMGLSLADGEKALAELGTKLESFISKSVRAVITCPSKPHCPMAQQDSSALGLALDSEFFGQEVPGKLRIGVSGCPNCCAEVMVKDIGMFATAKGYTLAVGGNSGRHAQVARIIAENMPSEEISPAIRSILAYYQKYGQPKERLGQVIDRLGWDNFVNQTIPAGYRK